jgi:hypothetical protein
MHFLLFSRELLSRRRHMACAKQLRPCDGDAKGADPFAELERNDRRMYPLILRTNLKRKRKLQREILFRGSIAWLLDSLCTLRSAGCPHTTQHSLPAAGQALPGEIISLGSNETFHVMNS